MKSSLPIENKYFQIIPILKLRFTERRGGRGRSVERNAAAGNMRPRDSDVHGAEKQQSLETALRAVVAHQERHPSPAHHGRHPRSTSLSPSVSSQKYSINCS